jgi:hypothetical protein
MYSYYKPPSRKDYTYFLKKRLAKLPTLLQKEFE